MLDKDELLNILDSWSYWSKEPPKSIPRAVAPSTPVQPEIATVIQGVRRCGKSTLLRQIMDVHGIDKKNAVFINFEDPRLVNQLDHTLLEHIFSFSTQTRTSHLTFFLDEIQNVSHWQKWLSSKLEQQTPHQFVVTGSNSRLLAGELGTALTGRHVTLELFPFDLQEFHQVFKRGTLKSFLQKGGFPGVLKFAEPERLLRQYFRDIVERDVRERVSARQSQPLIMVAQMVFEAVGTELSIRRIAGASGLSPDTVNLYLQACEDAYLILGCPYFAYSEAKRTRRNKKYYVIDTALRRAVSSKVGEDLGKDFENLVYLTLRRKARHVCYWRGKGEVDFVVNTKSGVTPLQVSYGPPKERHETALQEFYAAFPHANEAIFVTPESYPELLEMEI
jgi:predicted AAA+ superfamily ATPase